ncbi:MAG: group III truncated hemoglobin [Flavobacteriales bacterium]|nr:group III truncated hemoglobin [Flavobacteriales bacterium]
MPKPRDINTREDVQALVMAFYDSARPDKEIGHFFVDVDWGHHIPLITAFWCMVILGERDYQGDPMTAHMRLHQRMPMLPAHFDRWLALWERTVDDLFQGPKAEEAKQRARSIAGVMAHRVTGRQAG